MDEDTELFGKRAVHYCADCGCTWSHYLPHGGPYPCAASDAALCVRCHLQRYRDACSNGPGIEAAAHDASDRGALADRRVVSPSTAY